MMKWLARLAFVLGIAAIGLWGWRVLFPSPERVIRKRLTELARTASFSGNEAALARLANARAVTLFFTPDVEITVDIPGRSRLTFNGRDELLQAAAGAGSAGRGLNLAFLDIIITLAPDQNSAIAELTATAKVTGEKDLYVQELKFRLRKVDGDWLIFQVENLKTLSAHTVERNSA